MPDNRRMSDKVPKGMLKSTKDLPIKSPKQNRRPTSKQAKSGQTQERTQFGHARPGQPGQARRGQAKSGQARNGQARNGQAQPGQARNGQAQPGQAWNGQAQPGRARFGQAQSGQQYSGAAPGSAAQKPQISPQARMAAEKAMRTKTTPKKRRGRRVGNYILYYLLAAIIVVVVMIILANTVLFKCVEIEVYGNARYSAADIISRSGLKVGDNLLHVNTGEAAGNIVGSLAYIDKAEVKRSFPTRFIITVDEAEKWFALSQNGVTAAISRMGKILEHGSTDGLTVVKGFDAETVEAGKWLRSMTDGKDDVPQLIFDAVEKSGLKELDEIDMTDKFAIKLSVDGGRVLLELGPATEVESKLRVAAAIIENELGAEESVTLLLTNPEKVAAKNKPKPPGMSSSSSTVSIPPPESSEPPVTEETDEPDWVTDEPEYWAPTYEPTDDTTYEPDYAYPGSEEPWYAE